MKLQKKDIIWIGLLMILALSLSVTRLQEDRVISNDGCSYATTAKNLAEGKGYTYAGYYNIVFPPIYPFAIAVAYQFDNNLERAAIAVSIIAWVLTVIPVYLLLMLIFPTLLYARILAAMMIILSAQLNYIAGKILSESTYILILFSAITYFTYFIIYKKDYRIVHFIASGAIFSVAYLTRPEGFIFLLLTILFTLIFLNIDIKKRILKALSILIAFFIIASPNLIFLKNYTGYWQLSGRFGITLIGGERVTDESHWIRFEKELYDITPDGKGVYMYAGKPVSLPKYMIHNFPVLMKRFVKNFVNYFKELWELLFPLGLIAFLFLFFLKTEPLTDKKKIIYLAMMLLPIFASMFFFLYERYIYPYIPILYIFCAYGLIKLEKFLSGRFKLNKKLIIGALFIFIVIANLNTFLPYFKTHKAAKRPWNEVKELSLWMKKNIPDIEDKVLVSRKAHPAFYSDMDYRALPWIENLEDLYQYLDNVNTDYLITDTRYFYNARPAIYYLVEKNRKFDRLTFIKIINNKKHSALLWKFNKKNTYIR